MSDHGMASLDGSRATSLPRKPRSISVSSDRASNGGINGLLSPPSVSPDPGFIAASAASQIVTNDFDARTGAWFDQHGLEPSGETVLVLPPALKLINSFLDQLLLNFLATARSTSISSLRPAVLEVLKPKLAKDAISGAEDELDEYLGGEGDDDEPCLTPSEMARKWDLELVWKRARLRCMVYSSLGDMEEEDEDYYTDQGHLDATENSAIGVVSPAAAIFLTSILEFMGEQALVVAGQAAFQRLRAKHDKDERDGTLNISDMAERVIIETGDVERIALDRTLGKLWRGWRKRIRSPSISMSVGRSYSIDSRSHSRRASMENDPPLMNQMGNSPIPEVLEDEHAATIPLPMRDSDIREIEIPGVAPDIDGENAEAPSDEIENIKPRRKSMVAYKTPQEDVPELPTTSEVQSPPFSTTAGRTRSSSVPSARSQFSSMFYRPQVPQVLLEHRHEASDADSDSNLDADLDGESVYSQSEREDQHERQQDAQAEDTAQDGTTQLRPRDRKPARPKSMMAGVAATAAALGGAAYAGLTAVANGEAPMTEAEHDEEEPVVEEPKIITSHRISVDTRSFSSDGLERNSGVSSAQSLRIVDVPSPRTLSFSGTRYLEASDNMSTSSLSRNTSVHSTLAAELQAARQPSPLQRNPSPTMLQRSSGSEPANRSSNSVDDSTSEVESGVFGNTGNFARSITPETNLAAPSENIVPHLTPLREMMEGAEDTSYESSYTTPSNAESSIAGVPESSSKQKIGRTPAGSARLSPPRSEPAKTHRRFPASASGSSSSTKLRPVRTSEDSSGQSLDSKGPSFEELIRSDETIQYTLTPQSMRAMDDDDNWSRPRQTSNGVSNPSSLPKSAKGSKMPALTSHPTDAPRRGSAANSTRSRNAPQPRDARIERDSMGDFADFIRSTGPPAPFNDRPPRSAPASRGHQGANGGPRNQSTALPRTSSATSLPKRSESSAGRSRLQAREAVIVREDSTSELIDFIRQGPSADKANPRIPRTVAPFRNTMDSEEMAGVTIPPGPAATIPERYSEASTSMSFEPSTDGIDGSINSQSALITGSSKANKLTGASPYQFDEPPRGKGPSKVDKLTGGSPYEFDEPPSGRGPSKLDKLTGEAASPFEDNGMPKRKTRRVRDPYAIDLSDEDEEMEAIEALEAGYEPKPKPKPQRQEESLLDFLNSVPPPPSPTGVRFDVPEPDNKNVKRKGSTPGLIARFARRDPKTNEPTTTHKLQSNRAPAMRPAANTGSRTATHTPIPTNYPPSSSVAQPILPPTDRPSQLNNAGETPRSQAVRRPIAAREPATMPKTATSDLADFLLNSEPPPSPTPRAFEPPEKEESGLRRMFGRKKVAGY